MNINRKVVSTSLFTALFALTTFAGTALALDTSIIQFVNPRIKTIAKIDDSKYYRLKDLVVSGVTTPVTSGMTSDVSSEVTSEVTSTVVSAGGPSEVTSEVTSIVTSQVTSAVTSGVASKVAVPKEIAGKIDTKTLPVMTGETLIKIAEQDVKENPKKYELSIDEITKFFELYGTKIDQETIKIDTVKLDLR